MPGIPREVHDTMRRAQELLRGESPKVEHVAEACGFSNLRTFQRACQRQEGLPPTRWRQLNPVE